MHTVGQKEEEARHKNKHTLTGARLRTCKYAMKFFVLPLITSSRCRYCCSSRVIMH